MSLHPVFEASVQNVSKAASVEAGIIVLFRELHTQLVTALHGAKANGATEEQLKPLTDLIGALGTSAEDVSKVFHGKGHGKTPAEEAAEVAQSDHQNQRSANTAGTEPTPPSPRPESSTLLDQKQANREQLEDQRRGENITSKPPKKSGGA